MTKKRILITGKDSYIGQSFINYCAEHESEFVIDVLSVRGESWTEFDFSTYDSIFHVAGIAHNSSNPKLEGLYYQVNRDLTIAIATKAKEHGVKQFIFMSSIIVFGNNPNGKTHITAKTQPNPNSFYGDSKLQAEIGLEMLHSEDFKVAILRPPMIYGKGSKGNYSILAKVARRTPLFPNYPNKRSILYIDNLCKFVGLIIKNEESGKFYPQNEDYVQTTALVTAIGEIHKKRILTPKIFNVLISSLFFLSIIRKVFGDLYFDQEMSKYNKDNYREFDLKQSIYLTEK